MAAVPPLTNITNGLNNNIIGSRSMEENNINGNGLMRRRKGAWSAEEDGMLISYIKKNGEGNWNGVEAFSGVSRDAKSCRFRWMNHLRPGLKKAPISPQEEARIIELHATYGNKWSLLAKQLPGRTDNEIKNHWNSRKYRLERKRLPTHLSPAPPPAPGENIQLQSQYAGDIIGCNINPSNILPAATNYTNIIPLPDLKCLDVYNPLIERLSSAPHNHRFVSYPLHPRPAAKRFKASPQTHHIINYSDQNNINATLLGGTLGRIPLYPTNLSPPVEDNISINSLYPPHPVLTPAIQENNKTQNKWSIMSEDGNGCNNSSVTLSGVTYKNPLPDWDYINRDHYALGSQEYLDPPLLTPAMQQNQQPKNAWPLMSGNGDGCNNPSDILSGVTYEDNLLPDWDYIYSEDLELERQKYLDPPVLTPEIQQNENALPFMSGNGDGYNNSSDILSGATYEDNPLTDLENNDLDNYALELENYLEQNENTLPFMSGDGDGYNNSSDILPGATYEDNPLTDLENTDLDSYALELENYLEQD